ncbi:reverse transcriptase domain-containing protein [Tanacetum coccineum]
MKKSLAPERNEAIHVKVEELIKGNILQEVKYQMWVSNPVIVKKADGRWKLSRQDTPFHEDTKKLHMWKDILMDNRSRRSLTKNERVHRGTTNGNRPNQRRSFGNVPRSLKRQYKHGAVSRKRKEANSCVLCQPNSSRSTNRIPEIGETYISTHICCKKTPKGHILAGFLAETTSTENEEVKGRETKRKEPDPEDTWKLFTDRASSSDGSGARLMLVIPEGKEYTYALRFEFKTTNNEAEYESLLSGLRIAIEMEIQEL